MPLINEQLQCAKLLHDATTSFIQQKNFADFFAPYGELFYTGSYAANLMVWKDIDMQITLKDSSISPIEQFTQMSNHFLADPDVRSVKLMNFRPGSSPGMPSGMYMGLDYKILDTKEKWKVDLWSLQPEDFQKNVAFMKEVEEKMTEEKRQKILQWKFRMMGDHDRVPKLGSYYLYKAIIFAGLLRDSEIHDYLNSHGVSFT